MVERLRIGDKVFMSPRDYRDLRAWHASVELAEAVCSMTESFPAREVFGITAQMRRAAVSIASNIAGGNARSSTPDFLRYLAIARGSLAELDTQLVIARHLGCLCASEPDSARSRIDAIQRMLKRPGQALHQRLDRGGG